MSNKANYTPSVQPDSTVDSSEVRSFVKVWRRKTTGPGEI